MGAAASAGLSECGGCFVRFPSGGPGVRGPQPGERPGLPPLEGCVPLPLPPFPESPPQGCRQPCSVRPFINHSFLFRGVR